MEPRLKHRSFRILVIDDNAAIHQDFKKILTKAQAKGNGLQDMESALFGSGAQGPGPAVTFEIDCVSQGTDGLALARKANAEARPYALAFVDGRMPPGWDGVETIGRLWRDCPDLQAVLCAAYSDYSWQEIHRVLGETDGLLILKKPFDNVEVLQLAHTLTRKWELNREVQDRIENLDEQVREKTEEKDRLGALLEAALEHSPAGIVITDADKGGVLWANPASLQILGTHALPDAGGGIRPDEGWQAFRSDGVKYTPDELPLVRAIRKGDIIENEVFVIRNDKGDVKWISSNAAPIRARDETILAGILVFQDITEHIRVQEALKESETKYRSMMEAMKDSVYICSPGGRVEYMNPRMIQRIGRDATGEPCHKAIYGYDDTCPWCRFETVQKGDYVDYEMLDPRDGRYYSVTNSPIYHSGGRISNLSICQDITEKKSIEAQLHQARKMESIGTMAGGIAHDFNNILSIITGNAELAMQYVNEREPCSINIREIKNAALRAAGVIKQLLNFSRKTGQEYLPIDAVAAIRESLKFLRSTIPASVEIRKKLPTKVVIISGDATQIHQLMMNLCINASHAMEDTGGVLEIAAEQILLDMKTIGLHPDLTPGDWLRISVSDTGPGIDPENMGRIFDPYFTTKDFGKGTGMGLSVVHGIIRNHRGTITVDSAPGKGARFTIYLPVVALAGESRLVQTAPELIPKGTGEKILFVDDETAIVKMIGDMLESIGYVVETQTKPDEALALFASDPDTFDLVVTDMTMPKMTGLKLCERIKEIRPDCLVVLCTGYSPLIDAEKAKELGLDGFSMKPLRLKDLAKTIRELLDSGRNRSEN